MSAERAVCAILAAGISKRMGAQKVLLPFAGSTLLERALDAAGDRRSVAVVSRPLATVVRDRPNVRIVLNSESALGMKRSLVLANEALDERGVRLVVLLADTPLVDAALVDAIVAARGAADVAYPVRNGVGGHPVVFGPRARAEIASLRDGDTLRTLRDDPRWQRIEVPVEGEAPFTDVDTPEDLARARELFSIALEPAQASRSLRPGE